MTLMEAIEQRHSVRRYLDKPIEDETLQKLQKEIEACAAEGGIGIRLILNEPKAFSSPLARYGSFRGVKNYILLSGKPADDLEERVGYFGERLVLYLQQLGLNSCWVGLTYNRRLARQHLAAGEVLVCALAIGYGESGGTPHKSKIREKLFACDGEMPAWFANGLRAALLAPTAVNQQKFLISLKEEKLAIEELGGPYSKVDLGIVKYHFEAGAGAEFPGWSE